MALPARHRLRDAPPRGQLERLLGATIGANAARVGRELDGTRPLEELPGAVGEKRRNEDEVRDRDEDAEDGHPPPLSQARDCATQALLTVERMDRDAPSRGGSVVAGERDALHARYSGGHPHCTE